MPGKRYYIIKDGERLYRDTVQAISTLAQKLANRTGQAVQVHYENERIGRGPSHRKAPSRGTATYRRNPRGPRITTRAAYTLDAKGRERRDGWDVFIDGQWHDRFSTKAKAMAEVRHLKRGSRMTPNPLKRGSSRTTISANIAKMRREGYPADQAAAAAYRSARNPASPRKISKGKRRGQAKRGYYVEYKMGAALERDLYRNKGLATIAANELKRSGATRVRVYGA